MSTQSLSDNNLEKWTERGEKVLAKLQALPLSFWKNLVLLLALIWLVNSAAKGFWLIFPVPDLPQPTKFAAPVQAVAANNSSRSVDVESIKSKKFFGEFSEEAQEEQASQVDVAVGVDNRETRLSLKLMGVIASNDPDMARAIISDAGGNKQSSYRKGETLPQGNRVTLAQINDAFVVLNNNGNLENLYLYSEEDFKKSAASGRRVQSPAQQRAPTSFKRPENADRSIRTSIRPEQMPKTISDVVRFSVHRENGKLVGYRIRPGRDRALFEEVGLKNNDIVTSVNGLNVDDPSQLRTVYQSLKTATEAQLNVLRDGQTYSITISLNTGG